MLEILTPILLDKNINFMQARKVILKEIHNFYPQFDSQEYELVIEEPCFAIDSDSYDLLDGARNEDAD